MNYAPGVTSPMPFVGDGTAGMDFGMPMDFGGFAGPAAGAVEAWDLGQRLREQTLDSVKRRVCWVVWHPLVQWLDHRQRVLLRWEVASWNRHRWWSGWGWRAQSVH